MKALKKWTSFLHLCSFGLLPMLGLQECQEQVAPLPDDATPVQIRETIDTQKAVGQLVDEKCEGSDCRVTVPDIGQSVNQAVSPPCANCLAQMTDQPSPPTPLLPPACRVQEDGDSYQVTDDTGEIFTIPEGITSDIYFTECVDRPDMVQAKYVPHPEPSPKRTPLDNKFKKLIETLRTNTKRKCKKRDWREQNYNPKKYEYGGVYTCKVPPATIRANSSRTGRPGSIGRCYNYVKMGLMAAGLEVPPGQYPGGANAYQAAGANGALEKSGFTNTMSNICESPTICDPAKIPRNAIIVYDAGHYPPGHKRAGQKKPGHIEVKAGPNEYLSDFHANNPYHAYKGSAKILGIYTR